MSSIDIELDERLGSSLRLLKRKNRYRELAPSKGIDLSSNDYLGLADHPRIRATLAEALSEGIPLGSTGSRLLRGNTNWHEAMETRLARFKKTEAALIFNSGYEANIGVLTTLCGAADLVYADALIHASMIDGLRWSKAERISFPHNDMVALERELETARSGRRKFILVESVYSMDGDRAPLTTIARLAEKYRAHLIVDEAHATGVFGATGAGLTEQAGIKPLASIHTCGKAWGGFGAFVACSRAVRDYLINHCRRFIFTTALPPLIMVQWEAVLDTLESEPWRREKALANAQRLREGLCGYADTGNSDSQIVPVLLGSERTALDAAFALQAEGFDIRAIRPPSVPRNSSRLRIAVNAKLETQQLDNLIRCCRHVLGGSHD